MKSGRTDEAPTPVVLAHSPAFRIGAFEVRPPTREVIGPGGREVIEPRIMQVLVALREAGGEIVSRDDLIGGCWDGRAVGDDAINRVISKLRRVAETVGGGAFRIETITKVGYRLVEAAAERSAAPPGAGQAQTQPPGAARGLSRRAMLGGGLAVLTVGGGGAYLWWPGRARASPEALAHFERGDALARDPSRWTQAAEAFQRAVDVDPDFADGWGHLALALEVSRYAQPPQAADLTGRRAQDAAGRALALDPDNAAAVTAQALAIPMYGDWLTVETRLRAALASNPRQFIARDTLARVLENVGRTREAISVVEPYEDLFRDAAGVHFRMAVMLWSAGRVDEAERWIDGAIARWPLVYPVWFSRYWLYVRTGRPAAALAMTRNLPRPPGIPDWNFQLNDLHAQAVLTRAPADIERAVSANRDAAARGAGFCENAINLAAQLGLVDEAFRLAEGYYFGRGFRVAAARFPGSTNMFTPPYRRLTGYLFTPNIASMRADPRFGPMMEEMGLASYWRRSGTRADVLA